MISLPITSASGLVETKTVAVARCPATGFARGKMNHCNHNESVEVDILNSSITLSKEQFAASAATKIEAAVRRTKLVLTTSINWY